MPIDAMHTIPDLGAPYAVTRWTLVVEIVCRQCEKNATLHLTNTQEAVCPHCHAVYACGGMRWDVMMPAQPVRFKISHSRPVRTPVVD